MKLKYKATTADGQMSQGLLDAKDISEAAVYLRSKNLVPIQITQVDTDIFANLPFFNRVKNSDIILFTRQLSSMLTSGLTLMRALEILKNQIQNKMMVEVVDSVITEIEEGKTLSQALAKHPKVFTPIYISIIKAGEQSGLLDKVLLRLADNLEKQSKLASTIKSALMYPAVVVIMMIGVMFAMMIFVIPQLTGMYVQMNIDLPLPTKIIIGMSNLAIATWPVILVGLVIFTVGFRKWGKTPDGRLIIDSLMLKLPIFGKLIKETTIAEFARTFGLLVGTGSLVVESLIQTADTTGNVHYKNAITELSKRVEKGVTIGEAMSYNPLFPPLLIQLVKVGEQTGKVDETLGRASEYFEREVDGVVKNLTTLMEPFIMLALGLGVGFLIISIILPIYKLTSAF